MTGFNRNRKRGEGARLSADWLPPPPHREVLGPLAAAELRQPDGRGGGGTEAERSVTRVDAASLREPAVCSASHNSTIHTYLL